MHYASMIVAMLCLFATAGLAQPAQKDDIQGLPSLVCPIIVPGSPQHASNSATQAPITTNAATRFFQLQSAPTRTRSRRPTTNSSSKTKSKRTSPKSVRATIPNPGRVGIWNPSAYQPANFSPTRGTQSTAAKEPPKPTNAAGTLDLNFKLIYPGSSDASGSLDQEPTPEKEPTAFVFRQPELTTALPSGFGATRQSAGRTTGHATTIGTGRRPTRSRVNLAPPPVRQPRSVGTCRRG